MSEVLDVIHRLSYEVNGSESVVGVTNELKKQAQTYIDLSKKVEQYQTAISDADKQEIALLERLQAELARVNAQRQSVLNTLKNTIAASPAAKKALSDEIGLITQLKDKLSDLERVRNRASSAGQIKEVNIEIAKTKDQLNDLLKLGGNGFIAQIFGFNSSGGTIGRQLLTGTLLGLGIGGGFGIITRLVSGLVEYGSALIDVEKKEENFNKSLEGTIDAIEKTVKAFTDLERETDNLFSTNSLNNLKSQLDLLKAVGVQQGELFDYRQKTHVAQQKYNQEDIDQLKATLSSYEQLQTAIDFLPPDKKASTALADLQNNPPGNVPTTLIKSTSESIKKLGKDVTVGDLSGILIKQLQDLRQQIKQKQDTYRDEDLKNESDQARDIYQINYDLNKRIRAGEAALQQERQHDAVLTTETITEQLRIQKEEEIAKLNDEQDLARKNGTLTVETLKQFNTLRQQVQDTADQKQLEQIRAFNLAQVRENAQYQQQFLTRRLGFDQSRLPLLASNNDDESLLVRRNIVNEQRKIALAKNSQDYSDTILQDDRLQAQRRKAGEEETEEYKTTEERLRSVYIQFAEQEENIVRDSNIKKLGIYGDYYKNLIDLTQKNIEILNQELRNGGLQKDLGIADIANFNVNSIKPLTERQKRAVAINDLRTGINTDTNTIISNQNLLRGQQDVTNTAFNNSLKSSSPEEQVAAEVEYNKQLKIQQDLEEKILLTTIDLQSKKDALDAKRKEQILSYIDLLQQAAETAVQSYNIIADARQKDLEREISVRTERVNEAEKLAERGNTTALAQEQKGLDASIQQQRQAALQQQEVNAALTVSNALLAVAKAAVEGGGFASIGAIAAVIAALGIGFAEAESLSASQKTQFYKGGYTGNGDAHAEAGVVHKGEFVFNKRLTDKYLPLFEYMHQNEKLPEGVRASGSATSAKDMADIKEGLSNVVDTLHQTVGTIRVSQNVDQNGVSQLVRNATIRHNARWR